jgi:hypothetical protein
MKISNNLNPMRLFAEIMTNKYFLIFIAVLSAINIIGYLSMGYTHTVILFAMVAYLTFVFSKNMTVVLLVSFVVVNLYMQTIGGAVEGFQKKDGTNLSNGDVGLHTSRLGLQNMNDVELEDKDDLLEEEEPETNTTTETVENSSSPPPQIESFDGGIEPAEKKKDPRIDYASTLESAYSNLQSMLTSGGLSSLSDDTKKLVEQQGKLFESMDSIAPLLKQAQSLMTSMKFDEDKDGNIGGTLANAATPVDSNKSNENIVEKMVNSKRRVVGKEALTKKTNQ